MYEFFFSYFEVKYINLMILLWILFMLLRLVFVCFFEVVDEGFKFDVED